MCCVGGGTEGVRSHMRDRCSLRCCSGGRRCSTRDIPSSGTSDEAATNLLGGRELTTRKRTRPRDRITRTLVFRCFRLEQSQHSIRTIRRPRGDDPSISFAQRLRRSHGTL